MSNYNTLNRKPLSFFLHPPPKEFTEGLSNIKCTVIENSITIDISQLSYLNLRLNFNFDFETVCVSMSKPKFSAKWEFDIDDSSSILHYIDMANTCLSETNKAIFL